MYGGPYNRRSMTPETESDRDLARRLSRGDGAAWSEFTRRFIRLVVHVTRETLLQKTGRAIEEDVDDVTHEVFAHLVDHNFRAFANLREPYNLKAWIAVAARRKALDHCKKRTVRALSLDQETGDESRLMDQIAGPDAGPPPDAEEVRLALDSAPLNPKEKLLITLAFFRDKSYAEISELLGMPENSIGPTLRRALDKVRETMKKRGVSR